MKKRDPNELVRWVVETDRRTMNHYRRKARAAGKLSLSAARDAGIDLEAMASDTGDFGRAGSS